MRQQVSHLLLELTKLLDRIRRPLNLYLERELRGLLLLFRLDRLSRARDRISLVVKQRFDVQDRLHIAAAVQPLAGAPFVGLQLRELTLPEAQNVSWNVAEPGNLSNAEVQLVRNLGPGRSCLASNCLVLRHAGAPERPLPFPKYRTAQGQFSTSFIREHRFEGSCCILLLPAFGQLPSQVG